MNVGSCSKSCGKGTVNRRRSCTDPAPGKGGLPCKGDRADVAECGAECQGDRETLIWHHIVFTLNKV